MVLLSEKLEGGFGSLSEGPLRLVTPSWGAEGGGGGGGGPSKKFRLDERNKPIFSDVADVADVADEGEGRKAKRARSESKASCMLDAVREDEF